MKTLSFGKSITLLLIFIFILMLIAGMAAQASAGVVPHEPTPEPTYRALRSDYVRPWYIFKDTVQDGILDPGDTMLGTIGNTWTAVSSGTRMTYGDNAFDPNNPNINNLDRYSGPMNWATFTLDASDANKNDPAYNYWLPKKANTIRFFLSYSQFDNIDWFGSHPDMGFDANSTKIIQQRNERRNGWNLGWVINDYTNEVNQVPAGFVNMDIAIHNGKLDANIKGFGRSVSDPQVSLSDDVDRVLGEDWAGEGTFPNRWHPANWDSNTSSYSQAVNSLRMTCNLHNTTTDLTALVNSQELKEANGFNTGLKDHTGVNDYWYQDAFTEDANYVKTSTDGGVITGLGGYNNLNDQWSNWGDQQVIRIKIDPNTLMAGGITEVSFFNFDPNGSSPGDANTGQVNPTLHTLYADAGGNLYYQDGMNKIFFPDNIIYIAMSDIPEPASLGLLIVGGAVVLLKRRYLRD